jgi:MFS family permease
MTAPSAPANRAPGPTRWWILAFASLMLYGNYYVYDAIGPLADHLQRLLGYSDTQIGTLNAIYSLPNIFMVLIGGVLVDRYGPARVGVWTTAICLLGAIVTAASGSFTMMAAGRLLFGLGSETMIVAVTSAIGLWFLGRSLALALALNISLGRAGSYTADVSPVWASSAYESGWQAPLWITVAFAALGFAAAVAYWIVDRRAAPGPHVASDATAGRIVWRDLLRFDRSYWHIVVLCLLFYAVILPFRSTFAIKYFQHGYDLTLEAASLMNSYVYLAAIFASPLFGWLADRYGRRTSLLLFGSLLLPITFGLLGIGGVDLWLITVLIGISFSLVPALLWPSVAHVVEPARIGTAYGLMTLLQNAGLTVSNYVVGRLNDAGGANAANPEGYAAMLWYFGILAVVAVVFALLLRRREIGPQGHGLEMPEARGLRAEG